MLWSCNAMKLSITTVVYHGTLKGMSYLFSYPESAIQRELAPGKTQSESNVIRICLYSRKYLPTYSG